MNELKPHIQHEFRYFYLIAMAFTAVLLVSNVAAQKLFAFGPFTFTAGIIVFPISYIFGDVLTEVYGYARTRRVIWMGFVCSAFMALVLFISVKLPPAEGWPFQREFATVFELVPRIVAASLLACCCNSYVLAKIKALMEGTYLWVITISSTIVGQAIDTSMFVMVSFSGPARKCLLFRRSYLGIYLRFVMKRPSPHLLI
jgi:queuosine precursor transporter